MEAYWNQFQSLLFKDMGHAWILVSLIYWLAALLLQAVFTRPIRKSAKRIGSKNTKALHQYYLFRSLAGWFFFAAAWGLFILYWYARYFPASGIPNIPWVFAVGCGLFFLISVIFHITAYTVSCLERIKALEDNQLAA